MTESVRRKIALLPKAELHLHLEGSVSPRTAAQLAARHGISLAPEEVASRYQYRDFAGFIEAFKWITSLVRDPAGYALVARQLCAELLRQNVIYAEITLSAGVMLLRGQDVAANLAAIREAAHDAANGRLRCAWILDCVRQFGPEAAMDVARRAVELRSAGVVAFGMGGDELSAPAAAFRQAFEFARQSGLRLVCHAGETGDAGSVRDAIEVLGAERIGHGIAAARDEALLDLLAERKIPLEICPQSNLRTGALGKFLGRQDARIEEHPLPRLLARGVLVTLATDDPAMFHTDLLAEYAAAASMGLSETDLLRILEEAFRAAFLPGEEKRQALERFRAEAAALGFGSASASGAATKLL